MQSRKRSHFSPVNTGSALKDNHELLKSWSVEEVEEVLHAKKQEEDLKVRKKYEAKAKSDVDVANAKKEKSELEVRSSCLLTDHLSNQQQINYGYDFELYSSTSAKGTSER
jgi:hypothetical protein